jgi:hypothetical protein
MSLVTKSDLVSSRSLLLGALIIDAALSAAVAWNSYDMLGVLDEIKVGRRNGDEALIKSIEHWDTIAVGTFWTAMAVGIALVYWLGKCYGYAKDQLRVVELAQEKWRTWGWVVPVIWFYKPYQVIAELYKVGEPGYQHANGWNEVKPVGWLLAWWVFWALAHFYFWIVFQHAMKLTPDSTTISAVHEIYAGRAVNYSLGIVIVGLWVPVINTVTSRLLQRAPIARNSTEESAAPRAVEPQAPAPATLAVSGPAQTATRATKPTPKSVASKPFSTDNTVSTLVNPHPSRAAGVSKDPSTQPPTRTESLATAVGRSRASQPAPLVPAPDQGVVPVTDRQRDASVAMSTGDPLVRTAFAQAMHEIETKTYDDGLWAMAFVEANGDERAAGVIYMRARGTELAAAARLEAAERQGIELRREAAEREREATERDRTEAEAKKRRRQTIEAALGVGGLQAWKDFGIGAPTAEVALCKALPGLKSLGADPAAVNKIGEDVISYALRHGYLDLAHAALGCGLTIPVLVGGKTPIGVWAAQQPEHIATFVRKVLLPQIYQWMQANLGSKGLAEALWSMMRGLDLQPRDLVQFLATVGVRVDEKNDRFLLFRGRTDPVPEEIWNKRVLNVRARRILLDWLDREMHAEQSPSEGPLVSKSA